MRNMSRWCLSMCMVALGCCLCARGEQPARQANRQKIMPRPSRQRLFGGPGKESFLHALERLKKTKPEAYRQLSALKTDTETDKQAYVKALQTWLKPREVLAARLMFLEQECRNLVETHRQTQEAAEKDALKQQLTAKMEQAMDILIEDFKVRLATMEKQLQTMEQRRDQMVDRRVRKLLDDGESSRRQRKTVRGGKK